MGRGGRVLLRRAAPARRPHDAAEGAVDGRPDPAVRGRDARARAAGARCRSSTRRMEWFLEQPPRPGAARVALGRAGPRRAPAAVAAARAPHEAAAAAHARRDRVLSAYGVRALSQGTTSDDRTSSAWTATRSHACATSPASRDSGLFGGNSNWRGPIWFPVNYLHDRVAAEVPPLLRRRLPGRVPDRLRPAA